MKMQKNIAFRALILECLMKLRHMLNSLSFVNKCSESRDRYLGKSIGMLPGCVGMSLGGPRHS